MAPPIPPPPTLERIEDMSKPELVAPATADGAEDAAPIFRVAAGTDIMSRCFGHAERKTARRLILFERPRFRGQCNLPPTSAVVLINLAILRLAESKV